MSNSQKTRLAVPLTPPYFLNRLRLLLRSFFQSSIIALIYVGLYQVVAMRVRDDYKVPRLQVLVSAGANYAAEGLLRQDMQASAFRVLLGLSTGLISALAFALVMGLHPLLRRIIEPGLRLIRAIPAVALVPVAILLVGLNWKAQASIIALACMLPMWVSIQDSSDEWNRVYGNVAGMLHLPLKERWWRLQLPYLTATLGRALRLGAGTACYALVASEMLGAGNGLMYSANTSYDSGNMPRMYVSLVLLCVLCLVIDRFIDALARRARPIVSLES